MPYYYFCVTTSLPGFNKSDGGSRNPSLMPPFAQQRPKPLVCLDPKNLYLLHDAWKHSVFSYNFTWPPTPSAQMQYDPVATIHFSLWWRFNEFLSRCACMSLGFGSFFWSSSPSGRLGNASAAATDCHIFHFTSLNSAFENQNKSASLICTYWGLLFIYFVLNHNSNWNVNGTFPAIPPGKQQRGWTWDVLSFRDFGPQEMNWHCHSKIKIFLTMSMLLFCFSSDCTYSADMLEAPQNDTQYSQKLRSS